MQQTALPKFEVAKYPSGRRIEKSYEASKVFEESQVLLKPYNTAYRKRREIIENRIRKSKHEQAF